MLISHSYHGYYHLHLVQWAQFHGVTPTDIHYLKIIVTILLFENIKTTSLAAISYFFGISLIYLDS